MINRLLEDGSNLASQRRARTTLAHEAGHIILHTPLLTPPEHIQLHLLGPSKPTDSETVCREDFEVILKQGTYNGDWREYQANMVIGPLLLPRSLVSQALIKFVVANDFSGIMKLDKTRREEATLLLAEIFDVNPIVSRIRLGELYPDSTQLSL